MDRVAWGVTADRTVCATLWVGLCPRVCLLWPCLMSSSLQVMVTDEEDYILLKQANFLLLCLGSLADTATYAAFIPTFMALCAVLELPTTTPFGLAVTFAIVGILGYRAAGPMLQRFTTRQILIAALLIRIAAGALHVAAVTLPAAPPLVLLLASRSLHGLGAFTVPLASAYVGINVPVHDRIRYDTVSGGAEAIGALLGPSLGVAAVVGLLAFQLAASLYD